MVKLAKASALQARTQTINQLTVVLVAADPAPREALSGLTNTMLTPSLRAARGHHPQDVTSAAVYTPHLLARRILELTKEIHDLVHHITNTITGHYPRLLTHRSVGPDNTATLLIAAGDNPHRLRSEASLHRPVRRHPPRSILKAKPAVAASTTVASAKPTPRSIASPSAGRAATPVPATTPPTTSPKAQPTTKPSTASNATSPARSM